MTEYKETVSSLYFSLAAQCTEYDVEDVFTAYAYAGAFKTSCAPSDDCSASACTQTESVDASCFAMPFANIAPSKALAYSEISTVSTPSQKHPASFQVFNKALHVIDVGLAHALTSGIVKHVETLGTLFVVSSARAKAPQKVTTSKEKKNILLFERIVIVFIRAHEHTTTEQKKEDNRKQT